MQSFFKFFLDLLSDPALLVGLFALIGLTVQRAKGSEIVSGTLKTILGFVILGAGAGVLVGSLDIFGKIFFAAFQVQGVIPNNEAIVALALKDYGRTTALVMFFGMVANILLARFTPLKYIFLTGHHTLFMAALISVVLMTGGLQGVLLIVVGALLLGIMMVLMPAIIQPFTRKVTGSDDLALGHFGTIGYLAAALVGKFLGNTSKSTEDIKVPQSLLFLRDTTVAITITMTLLFLTVALVAGPAYVSANLSGGQNFILYIFKQAITFAAGVYIILAGVRMLISEIVPAFKGVSDKIVPSAKPALDCPTVFTFAPNAVIIGFLSSFVAGLLMMFITPRLGLAIIVPGLIPHFFTGAAAGVYGNATGGRRGAVLGAFTNGIIISILPALLLPVLGTLGFANTTFGDSDFGILGLILGLFVGIGK